MEDTWEQKPDRIAKYTNEGYDVNKLVVVIGISMVLCGCATKGRVALLDLDLRTPEQILAYQNEADIIYVPDCCVSNPIVVSTNATVKGATIPSPWDIIIKIIEVVKGRIRILSIEWKN